MYVATMLCFNVLKRDKGMARCHQLKSRVEEVIFQ